MSKVTWVKASDIRKNIIMLAKGLGLGHLDINRVHCYRSYGSKAKAYARIWGLPQVWQLSLPAKPQYVLEVLSEKYDKLPEKRKMEVLIHELSHIPLNFSGSLVPHIRHGKRNFKNKVDAMIEKYFANKRI